MKIPLDKLNIYAIIMLIAQAIARNGGDKTYVKFLNSTGLCGFELWGPDGASHDF